MKKILHLIITGFILFTVLPGCNQDCARAFQGCAEDCNGDQSCIDKCITEYNECDCLEFKFPVHFCVVTNNGTAANITIADLQAELDTLNKYFQAYDTAFPDDRRKIVLFTFKSATLYNQAVGTASPLVLLMDSALDFGINRGPIMTNFNNETDILVRDPNAINIYIIDNWNPTDSFAFSGSFGRNNNHKPAIFIDYERLGHVQAAIEHEMGHGFGLCHYCIPNTTTSSSTNIMASANSHPDTTGCDNLTGANKIPCSTPTTPGSGGLRNIAFDDCQVNLILQRAPIIMDSLGL